MDRTRLVTLFVIVVVFGCGLFLRLWGLGEQSLWIDEGYTINASMSVLEKGFPLLDSGKIYSNGTLFVYAAAGTMSVFGFDPFSPWAARLPAALAGSALILAVFFLGRRALGTKEAILAAAFIAFSYWEIAWSRQARGYALLGLALTLSLFWAWRALGPRFKAGSAVASVLAFAVACLSHAAALAFLPAFAFLVAARALTPHLSTHSRKAAALAILLSLAAIAIVVFEKLSLVETSPYVANYLKIIPGDLALALAGSMVGLVLAAFDRRRIEAAFPLIGFGLAATLSIALMSPHVQLRYFLPAFPFLILGFSYAAFRLGELLPDAWGGSRGIISVALAVAAFAPFLWLHPESSYRLERGSPQPDFKSAFALVSSSLRAGDMVVSPYAHLHKIYLGQKGSWLAMSLTGDEGEIERKSEGGVDYYVAAPIIHGPEMLATTLGQGSGFVILDSMARRKLPEEARVLRESADAKLVYESGSEADSSRIEVYRF